VPRIFFFANLAIVLGSASALAADPPLPLPARLDYEAAPGCPPASVLRGELARRLGNDPFVKSAPRRVVATIERAHGVLTGSVALYDSAGQLLWSRPTTPAMDCQAVVREMAGALAVRLDPLVYPEPAPPPKLAAEPPLPSQPVPMPVPVPAPRPRPLQPTPEPPRTTPGALAPWRVVVGVGPQIVIAAEPALSLVGHLGLMRPVFSPGTRFSIGMELRYDAPSSAAVEDQLGASVQTSFVGGSLVSCLHGTLLFGCAVVTGGALWVTSAGFDNSPTVRVAWGFVGTGPRVGIEAELRPRLAIRAYGEALISLHPLQGVLDHVKVPAPALAFPASGVAGASLIIYLGGRDDLPGKSPACGQVPQCDGPATPDSAGVARRFRPSCGAPRRARPFS